MFCTKCGNELAENSKFCIVCGAAVEPAKKPTKQKKSRKSIIAIIVIVLVIVIAAAIVLPMKLSGTETVYVITGYTVTTADGDVSYEPIVYDSAYNPVEYSSFYMFQQVEMSFDEERNIVSKTIYSNSDSEKKFGANSAYDYTYKNGKIDSCEESYNGKAFANWGFEWDAKGNLKQVLLSACADDAYMKIVRYDFEYDNKGRLTTEYITITNGNEIYNLVRCDYEYNKDGQLVAYECRRFAKQFSDYKDINYKLTGLSDSMIIKSWDVTYNQYGKIASVNIDGKVNTFDYDKDGNKVSWDEYAYTEDGRLDYIITDVGSKVKMEYMEVEMTKDDAARYYRWEQYLRLNYVTRDYFPLISDAQQNEAFFYYLVPNPVW